MAKCQRATVRREICTGYCCSACRGIADVLSRCHITAARDSKSHLAGGFRYRDIGNAVNHHTFIVFDGAGRCAIDAADGRTTGRIAQHDGQGFVFLQHTVLRCLHSESFAGFTGSKGQCVLRIREGIGRSRIAAA